MTKLVDRNALPGLIVVASDDRSTVMVGKNCGTDFVAKNTMFKDVVKNVARLCFTRNYSIVSLIISRNNSVELILLSLVILFLKGYTYTAR